MKSHSKLSKSLLSLVLALVIGSTSLLYAQVVVPIQEAGMVETTDFGSVPKEVLWTKDNQVMVLIPAGTYKIGRNPNPLLEIPVNETPEVSVTVGSFYIDKTEVSNAQYNKQLVNTGIGKPRSVTNQKLLIDDHPVIGISWGDAAGYAASVSKDLPTEAEWEIAARGRESYLYPWGNVDKPGAARVNFSLFEGTAPVGKTSGDVSPFGVNDMAGNASEWVRDFYIRNYYSEVNGKTNPQITENQESRSVRGGNFYGTNATGHLTYRNTVNPLFSREEIGFRTVFRLQKVQPTPTPTPAPPTPTPTPDPEDEIKAMENLLQPYFESPDKVLPSELVRLGAGGQSSPVVFFNQSPYKVTLGFVDPIKQLVFRYPTVIEAYGIQRINVPTAEPLDIFSAAQGSPNTGIVRLGRVNSVSQPFIVIPSYVYANTIRTDGKTSEPEKKYQLSQFYGKTYQPDWHVIEVFNSTSTPVDVRIDRIKPDGTVITSSNIVLDASEVGIFDNFPGTDLQISAKYLGATQEANSQKVVFKTNKSQDRRFFTLFEDKLGKTYTVQLSTLPEIGIRKQEVTIAKDFRTSYVLD